MALRKRLWRIIKENKGRYIGIVILILLGSFYFIAATGVANNLEKMVVGFAEEYRQEDLTFSTDIPIEDIAALEGESGTLIEAYRQYDVKLSGGELRLLSLSSKINIPAVLSGRGLENPGDILLDPYFCQKQGLNIGGQIELNGKTFNIVGTMAVPNYVFILKNLYDVLPTSGFGIGIVSGADIEAFPEAVTVYGARFKDRENLNAQTAKLHGLLSEKGYSLSEWLDAKNNKRVSMPWSNISSMKSMSFPVSTAFFLLSCLIVGVMIMRIVKSDGVVIGTLYAQGYRRRELTRHYMAIPVLLSAAGGLAGTLLALPCVRPVVDSMLIYYILPDKGITFSPLNLALAVLMPVAFIGLSSFLIIRKILKKPAVELMKGDEQKAKVNFIERALRLDRYSFNTKFQIREQVRSIPRLLFLVLGVSAASMVLLYGFTFNYSMDLVMNRGALERYNYAIEYNFKEVQNLQDRDIPEGAEPYNSFRAYPEGRETVEFYLLGMEPDSVGIKMNGIGGTELSRDQVNITYPLASRLKLKKGDTIHFVNKLDGKSYSLTIDGIIEAYGEQYVFMPLDEFNRMTGQPLGSYRTVLSNRELDFDESLLAGVMDARDPEAFEDLAMPTTLIVASVTALAVLIAVIIIFLVTSLMIDESRNTISLLKVLGYREKELAKLILNSSTPAVFIGFWLGLPFMLAFGNNLYGYVAEMINMVIPMIVNPLYVLISFVLIFAVYEITKRLCGRKLAKISMSEALKAGTE
ncbi:putative ABC transport system permease protein [Anaerosolibacter carboniphilus]|uniref:Putative ABC transport system permease protein n=1 Tax=Anaerosolibacter carboniphilus TaxID=1417629 RepID=A0A841KYG3_9FIRM|nr:FtsX-like permease family protein [Anaerosolibacter carboniphilus]MBB6218383.1 putative ABC transport system permease protein [Anaerosolibacter carboniphilus]